jgi:hypothetical protein
MDAAALANEGKSRAKHGTAEFLSVWAADRRKKKEQAA